MLGGLQNSGNGGGSGMSGGCGPQTSLSSGLSGGSGSQTGGGQKLWNLNQNEFSMTQSLGLTKVRGEIDR